VTRSRGLLNKSSLKEFSWPGADRGNSGKLGLSETWKRSIAKKSLELPLQGAEDRDFVGSSLEGQQRLLGRAVRAPAFAGLAAFPGSSLRAPAVELQPAFLKEAATRSGKAYGLGSATSFGKLFPWLMRLPRSCYSSLEEFESAAGSLPALLSAAAWRSASRDTKVLLQKDEMSGPGSRKLSGRAGDLSLLPPTKTTRVSFAQHLSIHQQPADLVSSRGDICRAGLPLAAGRSCRI